MSDLTDVSFCLGGSRIESYRAAHKFFNVISHIYIQIFYLQNIYRHVFNVQVRPAVGLLFTNLFRKVVGNKQSFKIFKQYNQGV